jgi:hypothetical protein
MAHSGTRWGLLVVTTLVGCGSSHDAQETAGAGTGGVAGTAMTGGAGAFTLGGAPGAGAGGAGAMAASGGSSGAAAGRGGSVNAAGRSGATDWQAACDGVTINGTCKGNVYQWCDYFTGALKSIDCTSRGMTCRANASEPGEVDRNGCVGSACTASGIACDGDVRTNCVDGELVATSCTKQRGPGAICTMSSGSASCSGGETCTSPRTSACDGSVIGLCTEDGQRRYVDCARRDPAGTCSDLGSGSYECGGILVGQ